MNFQIIFYKEETYRDHNVEVSQSETRIIDTWYEHKAAQAVRNGCKLYLSYAKFETH